MKVTDWRIDSPLEDCSRMEHSSRGTNPGAPLRKGGDEERRLDDPRGELYRTPLFDKYSLINTLPNFWSGGNTKMETYYIQST